MANIGQPHCIANPTRTHIAYVAHATTMMLRILALLGVTFAAIVSLSAVVVVAEQGKLFQQPTQFTTACTLRSVPTAQSFMTLYSTQTLTVTEDLLLEIEFNLFRNDIKCEASNLLLVVKITTLSVKEVEEPGGTYNLVDVTVDTVSVVPRMQMALVLLESQCTQEGGYIVDVPTVMENACPDLPFPQKSECPVYYFKMAVTPEEVEMTHFFKVSPPGVDPKQYICDPDDRPDFGEFATKLARGGGSGVQVIGGIDPIGSGSGDLTKEGGEKGGTTDVEDSDGGGGGGGSPVGAIVGALVGVVIVGLALYVWRTRVNEAGNGDKKKKKSAGGKSKPLTADARRTSHSTPGRSEDALVDSDDDDMFEDEADNSDNDAPEASCSSSSSKTGRMTRSPSAFISDV